MGAEDEKAQFAISFGFVTHGAGGALLRTGVTPTIELILSFS